MLEIYYLRLRDLAIAVQKNIDCLIKRGQSGKIIAPVTAVILPEFCLNYGEK
jgi:hypothetical protein